MECENKGGTLERERVFGLSNVVYKKQEKIKVTPAEKSTQISWVRGRSRGRVLC